ncbi:MAG: RHS repeat-associated core domain-containing protein, partial [Pedobacter sp.]
DRPVTVTDPLGYQTTFGYDTNSNITKMTDANANAGLQPKNSSGSTLYKVYDELNRVKSETDAQNGATNNGVTSYTYDLLGNITSITDAESRVTWFDYDDLGRLVKVRDPLIETPTDKATTFTYYETGQVLTRTKRSGATATYTIDNLNRPTQALYTSTAGSISESTAYDIYGNKYTMSNPDVMYTYAYDLKNRPTLKMDGRQGKFLQYTYDKVGNIATKTNYDGSTTEYRYDSANKLVAERNPDFLEVSYQYDGAGRLLSRILSNGAMTSYTWDDGNRLASLTNKSATGTIVNNTSYTRDRIGNITSQSDASGTTSFVYDPLYRLTSADYPGTANDQSFTYDKVGNRKTMTKGGTTVAYVVDTGNRMKEIRQSTQTGALLNSFVYDDDGNLTAKKNGSGTTIQSLYYDVKGRTTSVNSNSFKYDPYNYRIYKSDSHGSQYYLLEGEHLEAITNGTNWLAKYFRGAVIDEIVNGFQYDTNNVWTNYTFHHDALQSVLGLSGHEGSVLQTISYGPFGEKIATTGTANNNYLHFTGREEDSDSGLYNYRARIYDPTIGRFLTEDPKGFDAGVNFYVYVQNNPVNANDPMGLETEISNGTPTSYCHVNPHFDRNENKIGGLLVGGGLASVYAAPIFTMNSTEIAAYMGRISNGVYNTIVATGSAILTGAEKIGNGIDSAMKYLFYGSAKVDAGSPVVQNVLKYGVETIDAFVPGPPSPTIPGRIMGLYDLGNYITEQVSGNEISSSAAGGFVIYPNKTNLNMMHSVYSK